MREAPGTAGKAPYNTVVKIYDEKDNEVDQGESGRIFVGNTMLFGGYTGDEDEGKAMIDGLMSSGDVGRLDEDGRLFVEGRDDEMIVSGGENVFPKEVEDCLSRHDSVEDVAAIGVDDEEYGKRLRAFVVKKGDVEEKDAQGARQGEPGRLQGAARDRLPRRAAPQLDRQGAQEGPQGLRRGRPARRLVRGLMSGPSPAAGTMTA